MCYLRYRFPAGKVWISASSNRCSPQDVITSYSIHYTKLYDEQLYRLRQAKHAPPAEQRALAVETREIYAALANRLGVWQLKWELEDLSFRYLELV